MNPDTPLELHCEREIEITPEMVEAGYRVFVAACVTDDPLEADKLLVEEIYRAMSVFAPRPS